ncbi:MAG TPA: RDD family protein [Pseudonocardia sp.]|jgi:uncharacterized RDD family membrane protein YckC|nr:RDD family protein [Pseudonocardia sp.]
MARSSGSGSGGGGGSVRPGGPPGARLGLPAAGVGSAVGLGRRFGALMIDWLAAYLIGALVTGPGALEDPRLGFTVLLVWFGLTALPVAVFGASAGMTALGIRVASLGDAAVIGVPRAVLRTALVALVVPPLVRDEDGRGLHDRATRTVVVRTR